MKPSPAFAALTAARLDGCRFSVHGTVVAVRGPGTVLDHWAATLRLHKPELLLLLRAGA